MELLAMELIPVILFSIEEIVFNVHAKEIYSIHENHV